MHTQEPSRVMDKGTPHQAGKKCGAKTRHCLCGHHAKLHVDKRGPCGECGGTCQVYRPKPCTNPGSGAGGKCHIHGGKTPSGLESASFKTGRWSKHLPAAALGRGFEEAYGDSTLMQLRQDVALIDSLLTTYTASLRDTGRPLTVTQQDRVLLLLEQKRKHVESEAKRLRDLAQVVPIDQYRTALAVLGGLLKKHLEDNPQALRDVQQAAQRLLLGRGLKEGGTE